MKTTGQKSVKLHKYNIWTKNYLIICSNLSGSLKCIWFLVVFSFFFFFFCLPGVGRLTLIIPWVVLQELDNLKKGKMLQHVRDKAIPAVQFIYMCLKNQDSKLWGQSMQLASQKICNIRAINLFWVLNHCGLLGVNLSTKFWVSYSLHSAGC